MKLITITGEVIQRIIADDTTLLDDKLSMHEKVTEIQRKLASNSTVKILLTPIASSKFLLKRYIRESIRQDDVLALSRADALFAQHYPGIDLEQCFDPYIHYRVNRSFSVCHHSNRHKRVLLAVVHKQPDMLQHLLDHGYNCNSSDSTGRTALMKAIAHNDWASIAILLKCGDINLNVRSFYGRTALSIAIQRQNYSLVEHLLNHRNNINPNIECFAGHTALTLAMQNNDDYIVSLLCKDSRVNTQRQHFINISSRLLGHHLTHTPLMVAIQDRQWEYVNHLFSCSTQAEREKISSLLNRPKHNYLTENDKIDIDHAKKLLDSYSPIELLMHAMGSLLEHGVSEMLSSNRLTDIDAQHADGTIPLVRTMEQ